MKAEDEADKIVETMFDQMIEATPKEGKVGGRTLLDDALNGDEMLAACERMVIAHRQFDKLNDDPRKYHDPNVNLCWWHALNPRASGYPTHLSTRMRVRLATYCWK
jgi:hypothetical protein